MVTIISTCKEKLSIEEFVRPIIKIIENKGLKYRVIGYKNTNKFNFEDKVIITGTALKDFDYLNHIDKFKWIINYNKPILGICSGAQIIALVFGSKLLPDSKIGVFNVKVFVEDPIIKNEEFRAYFLTKRKIIPSKSLQIIAYSNDFPAIFKVIGRNIYGFTFHPEVLNQEIIERFVSL